MHLDQTPEQATQRSSVASWKQARETEMRLHGRVLVSARLLWLLIALFQLGVLLVNLPAFVALLHTACGDPTGVSCNYLQIRSAHLPALAHYGFSLNTYAVYALICDLTVTLLFLAVGGVIFWYKSDEIMGLFVSLLLITFGCFGISEVHLVLEPSGIWVPIFWLLIILQWPALGILFYTFPDGRFVPRWSWMLTSLFVIQLGFFALPYPYNIDNWPLLLNQFEMVVVYGSAAATQLYRYRAVASPLQRLQIKWFAFGFAATLALGTIWSLLPLVVPVLTNPDSWYPLLGPATLAFSYVLIPLGIGIALLRYRLWDIDILINRTLVYALLTASTAGLYVLIVFGVSALLRMHNDLFLSLLATALVAVLFHPLRERLQQGVNRVMFGNRDEPYRVLSRLGQRLQETLPAQTLLPTIVETVAQALKLPYVAIAITDTPERMPLGTEPNESAEPIESIDPTALPLLTEPTAARFPMVAFGKSQVHAPTRKLPLIHQGKHLGDLILSPRQRGEDLSPADQRLLRDLTPQIGLALHSVLLFAELQELTIDLQHSRERLVSTREEERRRLRRDLHDGLGPQLSSQTLMLSAVKKVLRHDPELAEHLVNEAITHAQEAIADIRRLVYALRPPALDDLGLIAALQEQMTHYQTSGMVLVLDAPPSLPPLPAATEIACYRIVQEALTNVMRHSHATAATIHVVVEKDLRVEVSDNGQGLASGVRSGVGLHSIRERAEELGGSCLIENQASGGTRVCVRLPLSNKAQQDHQEDRMTERREPREREEKEP